MSTPVILTKLCNAFVPSAETKRVALLSVATGAAERYKRKHGGLWVGGRVSVTEHQIEFIPNTLNTALHLNVGPIQIPLERVRSVQWQFGMLSGIVVVEYQDVDFRFRCFGAKRVVRQLAALVRPNGTMEPAA